MELTLLSEGKFKERWLEEGCAEYVKRLQRDLTVNYLWVKDAEQLERVALRQRHPICLDPLGSHYSSEEFSLFLMRQFEVSIHLCFVIGGACGLPPGLRARAPLISLSRMTFTHQCTRLLFLEQVYRAFEIDKGSSYHK